MKPTAVLVNTSRGPVVDQAALAAALRDGVIAAAGSGCHRPRADPDRRPAPRAGQLHRPAAHRIGDAGDARADGCDGRGEPAGRGARRAAADTGQGAGPVIVRERTCRARARTISLGWLVVAFSVAQLLDLVSALVVAREMNPIVAAHGLAAGPRLRAEVRADRPGRGHRRDLRPPTARPGSPRARRRGDRGSRRRPQQHAPDTVPQRVTRHPGRRPRGVTRGDRRVRCPRAGSSAVEHGTFNPLVVGSNPTRLANHSRSVGAQLELRRALDDQASVARLYTVL